MQRIEKSCFSEINKTTHLYKKFHLLFQMEVMIDDEEIDSVIGISFRNGFLDLKDMKLKPHNPEFFVTRTIPIDYHESEQLKEEYKKFFFLSCSGKISSLNHLRGFIRRSFVLDPECQTILLLTGPPGTGKSSFISFLSEIFGNMLLSFDARTRNQFDRSSWIGRRILVLNDVTQLDLLLVRLLRELSGRNRIKYDIKLKQVDKDFVYKGILIMVSNLSADALLTPLMDLAIFDRIIEVRFDYTASSRIRSLTPFFIKGASGFVNWALSCPDEVLQQQIRASSTSITSENLINIFIATKLFDGNKEKISISYLSREFELFMTENSMKLRERSTSNMFEILKECCLVFFKVSIKKIRASSGMFIQGIRMVLPNEESNFEFYNEKNSLDFINLCISTRKDPLFYPEQDINDILTRDLDDYVHKHNFPETPLSYMDDVIAKDGFVCCF